MEIASKNNADTTTSRLGSGNEGSVLSKRQRRTRAGNARLLTLDSLDGRTAVGQAIHALVANLVADLGGADRLSAGEMQLVTRAALTGAIVADFEARWVSGQQVALGDYLSAVNVQRRVLATLGLQRRSKDAGGLTLSDLVHLDHLETQRAKAAAAVDAEEAST